MSAPHISPSGRYLAELVAENDGDAGGYVRVRIRDDHGRVLFTSADRFPDWFSLTLAWDRSDRVWVRSGDSGTVVLAAGAQGWQRFVWDATAPAEPAAGRTVWDVEVEEEVAVIGGEPPSGLR